MDIRNLVIDAEQTLGDTFLLTDIQPSYIYDSNNKRTTNISGYKYVVAVPKLSLDKIAVKIEGELKLEKPDNDYPKVEFIELELSIYWTSQGYQVSAKAKDIMLVEN